MKDNKIHISCLPVAGKENPYQLLMIKGLNEKNELNAINGINNRFTGIIQTAIIQRPDYIHFEWIESFYFRRYLILTYISIPLFFLQLYFCKLISIKITGTVHNLSPHDTKHRKLHRFVYSKFLSLTHKIRVFNQKTIKTLQHQTHLNNSKFQVIPEGSYIGYYPDDASVDTAFNKLGLDAGKKYILFLGSIKPYKGIIELIKTFKSLKLQDTILLIAGKGTDIGFIESVNREKNSSLLVINRFIPENEIQLYFKVATFVVLPFKQIENSGSVILAMGFKKTIIAPLTNITAERLKFQPEFLFSENELPEKINFALNSSPEKLNDIGLMNYQSLHSFKWSDFSDFFKP